VRPPSRDSQTVPVRDGPNASPAWRDQSATVTVSTSSGTRTTGERSVASPIVRHAATPATGGSPVGVKPVAVHPLSPGSAPPASSTR